MEEEKLELQKRFDEIALVNDVDLYCHFTNSRGEDILEDGLHVANREWYKSFLKLDDQEKENICTFIQDNGNHYGRNKVMIIVAVFDDLEDSFIRKCQVDDETYSNWAYDGLPEYIVDKEFIFGYVDIDTMKLVVNNRSLVAEELMIL